MTHNDFCKVISETEKSVTCVMVRSEKITGGGYSGEEVVKPEAEYGKTFRLLKIAKTWGDGGIYYKGSYPFCGDDSKRLDSFVEIDPSKKFYYNTVD